MSLEGNNSVRHDFDYWTVDKLVKWHRCDLLNMWHSLDAPEPGEINGEYVIRYPIEREEEVQTFYAQPNSNGRGRRHLGKAFNPDLPVKDLPSQGYNVWLGNDGIERFSRFGWEIAPSTIDGRPSLNFEYDRFDNISKNGQMGLHDELRRVKKGLYLCIAYDRVWPRPPFKYAWNFEENRTMETVFLLFGPVNPWKGVDNPDAEPPMPD